jgi:inosine-uridine nucleoside N-ribohydrolase
LAGTQRRLARPPSHRIEDTAPLDLPASRFIVEHAREAHAERPLIIVTGGQLTTVANAYLLDPSIADKVVVSGVFGVRQQDYNAGLDSWAWKIVLSRFRVLAIPIGPPSHRGTVYQKPPRVPKNRIQSELPLDRPLFQWMYEKRHPNNELPAGHDWDGQAAIPLTRPSYITDITRWRAEGVDEDGNLILTEDSDGPIYQAQDADQAVATSEFWRVMHKVASTL